MFKTHNRLRTRKLRKQSRTIPLPGNAVRGNGEDAGKYFRCWHCGFICNVERDDLGDVDSTDGVSYTIHAQMYSTDVGTTPGGNPYGHPGGEIHGCNYPDALLKMCVLGHGHIVLKNGADGDPLGIYQNWTPDVTSGCPLCGCRNWRGDY